MHIISLLMQGETKILVERLLNILFSILMENNIFDGFFTKISVINFRKHFRNKNFCEKTIKYFIFHLDGKIIYYSFIYSRFFHLGNFHRVPPFVDIYI